MQLPLGLIVNALAVLAGGGFGAGAGKIIPQKLKSNLPVMFGMCSIAIAINSIVKVNSMTPVILAALCGFSIGQLIDLEAKTTRFFSWLVKTLHLGGSNIDMNFYITAVALFCFSGLGWQCALTEGIAGDPTLFFSKSVLDFFTAFIFASSLGFSICAIPIPQAVILFAVMMAGKGLSSFLTPNMFADLTACGGILTFAAGIRVSGIKIIPVVDIMPALILVIPLSYLFSYIF